MPRREENMLIMRRLAWTQQPAAPCIASAGQAKATRKRLSHPARMFWFAYVGRTVLGEEEHEENACTPPFYQEACATAACSRLLE
jgi:hypothetical protein